MSTAALTPIAPASPAAAAARSGPGRIASIDALRGLVMLLMLVDHTREFFFIHAQVSDPMDLTTTDPALFFTRLAAHLCAPVFVALTGLSAWLYASKKGGAGAASGFLFRRGLFLVALELTLVSFAWTFDLTPPTVFLQVIWAIGLSMIALAALVHLPRPALITVGLIIVLGHNLLDPVAFAPGHPAQPIWAVLHDRGYIDLPWGSQARTSYPLLPWIGVAALGYALGPWFIVEAAVRRRRLILLGFSMLGLFALLRGINLYGEPVRWALQSDLLRTVMSVLNLTKYPPSADFLLLTLGVGTLLLAGFEKARPRLVSGLAVFGGAPLFFYLIHLYALHLAYRACLAAFGANQGEVFGVPHIGWVWAIAVLAAIPAWFACRRFAALKRRSGQWWMKYL